MLVRKSRPILDRFPGHPPLKLFNSKLEFPTVGWKVFSSKIFEFKKMIGSKIFIRLFSYLRKFVYLMKFSTSWSEDFDISITQIRFVAPECLFRISSFFQRNCSDFKLERLGFCGTTSAVRELRLSLSWTASSSFANKTNASPVDLPSNVLIRKTPFSRFITFIPERNSRISSLTALNGNPLIRTLNKHFIFVSTYSYMTHKLWLTDSSTSLS